MKLTKASIQNFPLFQNVELTFEPSLKPSVFPIGSDNGEKTLFLQMLFSLLTNNRSFFDPYVLNDFKGQLTFQNGEVINYWIEKGEIARDNTLDVKCYLSLPSELLRQSNVIDKPYCTTGNMLSYNTLINATTKGGCCPNYQEVKINAVKRLVEKYSSDSTIFLFDEIENGLHPDWQYNIVDELASSNSQFLLGTHSFYLREALTPGHVKIINSKD